MTITKNMGRTFVIGDIHGAYIPLQQCLERSGFNKETDTLIILGDICDGWPYVYECVETLKDLLYIYIVGNHDMWFIRWLESGIHPDYWGQGGKGTAQSYLRNAGKDEGEFVESYAYMESGHTKKIFTFNLDYVDIPLDHVLFFKGHHLHYKDEQNRLFVHGGFEKEKTLKENQQHNPAAFYWDRRLWLQALSANDGQLKFTESFKEIFIGHTATTNWTTKETKTDAGIIIPKGSLITEPMHADIIWNLDTGAGSTGKLTIMDIDTHEFWQSDCVNDIYGDYKPR